MSTFWSLSSILWAVSAIWAFVSGESDTGTLRLIVAMVCIVLSGRSERIK